MDGLRELLLGGPQFLKFAHSFIDDAVGRHRDNPSFQEFYKLALTAVTEENAREIAEVAQSPIEKTFLNSLILTFVRNDGLGLLVAPTEKDTVAEIAQFRDDIKHWREFWNWFQKNKPANSVEEYLDEVVKRGGMLNEEREAYIRYIFRYSLFPMENNYHMTLQPRFRNLRGDGKEIRPDIYFWIPSRPEINIIVECDGFSYHSDKDAFKNDRQRDRIFKSLGYDVLRFSGSEIYADPVHTPYELAKFLWDRAKTNSPAASEVAPAPN